MRKESLPYVYTIWMQEGTQKPRIVSVNTQRTHANYDWRKLTKGVSLGYKFRMVKNRMNSKTKGHVIRRKH